ncbi:MAG: metalloregulator ArsR/SmtB family transcription factor [Hyphomicrobiaceae bacterium]|nr:metalloregulator ArsR/SmtB family transcription factor [Hyphomicrobiaceae bacterium]
MEHEAATAALAALAHTHRLAVFRRLVQAGPSGEAAGDIARALGIGATALSFHLKELDRAGLVRSWRDGRFIRYSADIEGMRQLLDFLTQDCCNGHPEICGGLAKVLDAASCGPAPRPAVLKSRGKR